MAVGEKVGYMLGARQEGVVERMGAPRPGLRAWHTHTVCSVPTPTPGPPCRMQEEHIRPMSSERLTLAGAPAHTLWHHPPGSLRSRPHAAHGG